MISFSCSWLLSQSTNISNSELRRLDFLDSMCTRLTWFSYSKHWNFVTIMLTKVNANNYGVTGILMYDTRGKAMVASTIYLYYIIRYL